MPGSRLRLYLFTIVTALGASLILAMILLRPPAGDLAYLALLLAVTGTISAAVGLFSSRLGWWQRVPSLRIAISLGYILATGLILLNVWVTAELMFVNEHDLNLAIVLMVFAAAIAIAFGYFLSGSITERLHRLEAAAARVSEGELGTRLEVDGDDEVAQVTAAFNLMAARLEAAAAHAQALDASRRNLIAGASHDLRTPVASLRAMVDALADGVVADPQTTARYLAQSREELIRLSALIDDLFELARLDAGGVALDGEHGYLSDLISDSLAALTPRATEVGVTLHGTVAPDVDPVWMDAAKIGRVLTNLLDNALRHTPTGGTIEVHALRNGDAVQVIVSDSGEGIPPEDLPLVFDTFYRGEKSRSRTGGGSGLGLAIARRLVEAHGGTISIESEAGAGADLIFTLPDAPPAGASALTAEG